MSPPADITDPEARRAREIDAFVQRHFGARGALRLHRAALGWDLLRAPLNVALAPVFLLSRLVAMLLRLVRLRRAGDWLAARRILLQSAVARRVETHIEAELFAERPLSPRARQLIADYTSVRSAVSEICTTLMVLAAGLAIFRSAVPGVLSLSPLVTGQIARSQALAEFPLGRGAGTLWYAVFPIEVPVWHVIVVGVLLAMAASIVTTFAGVLADPIQARLGIHRRRLTRLVAKIEAEEGKPEPIAREHLLARVADLSDLLLSAVRFFRP